MFLTDIMDDIHYDLIKARIIQLSRKHLILFVFLRDNILNQSADRPVSEEEDLFVRTAARELYIRRSKVINRMKNNRINVLDILPYELTGPLINKYLELKSKNRL